MDKDYIITKAEYFEDYKLFISFSDGVSNIFDFKNLVTSDREEYRPYLDVTKFKKFKIQRKISAIAWGKENNMQMPAYILYSEKRASKGWTKYESLAELKKRLLRKYYYEMFVDNNVWAWIHVIIELLEGDNNSDMFSEKFNEGVDDKRYLLEVFSNDFQLSIEIYQFGLVYKLTIHGIGSTSYEVNFENDVVGRDLEGEELEKHEMLFDRVWKLIEHNRESINTRFDVLK